MTWYQSNPHEDKPASQLFSEGSKCRIFELPMVYGAMTGVYRIFFDAPRFHLFYLDGSREEAECPEVEIPNPVNDDNFPWSIVIDSVQAKRPADYDKSVDFNEPS